MFSTRRQRHQEAQEALRPHVKTGPLEFMLICCNIMLCFMYVHDVLFPSSYTYIADAWIPYLKLKPENTYLNIFCKEKTLEGKRHQPKWRKICNDTALQSAFIKLQFSEDHGELKFLNVPRVFVDTLFMKGTIDKTSQLKSDSISAACYPKWARDPLRTRNKQLWLYLHITPELSQDKVFWGSLGGTETGAVGQGQKAWWAWPDRFLWLFVKDHALRSRATFASKC